MEIADFPNCTACFFKHTGVSQQQDLRWADKEKHNEVLTFPWSLPLIINIKNKLKKKKLASYFRSAWELPPWWHNRFSLSLLYVSCGTAQSSGDTSAQAGTAPAAWGLGLGEHLEAQNKPLGSASAVLFGVQFPHPSSAPWSMATFKLYGRY